MALADILAEFDREEIEGVSQNIWDLLNIPEARKVGVSHERIDNIIPTMRDYIAYWREYPDMFIDFLQTGVNGKIPETGLRFYFYQRVFLRVAMRYRYVYAVFPRAYSKSFLSVLVLMCRCILYPRAKLFVTSGGKEQSAQIVKEKVSELCTFVPALDRELDRRLGKTREGKDYVIYMFKNGSYFDNVAASEKSRGKRRHAGLVEECVGVDGEVLQQVIIPMMNISRPCMDGSVHNEEIINKAQLYITTAGFKATFAYRKLIQTLVQMITEPDKAFVMGGTFKIPVITGLLDKDFIQDLRRDGTFNEVSFLREYESKWAGTSEEAFFSGDAFDRNRVLQKPEYEHSGRSSALSYYILSMDVARKNTGKDGCDSVITVLKVTPQNYGEVSIKSLVNLYSLTNMHFEDQAIWAKRLFYKYKARRIVIDANGLGIGLVDYMVKSQIDPITGDEYPDFGVENDDENYYKRFKTANTEQDAMYLIKANAPINTEAHSNVQTQLTSGKLKFLIDERMAKVKLLGTQRGKQMTPDERTNYLKPYTLTSILREEMGNLREENEGFNIILKQANKTIRKDKFSALEYGLYYIKQDEDSKRKKKKKFNAAEWRFSSHIG